MEIKAPRTIKITISYKLIKAMQQEGRPGVVAKCAFAGKVLIAIGKGFKDVLLTHKGE